MSLLCDYKWWMHHASCTQSPHITCKPIGMRVCSSLPSFPQLPLKTWVATEVNLSSCFGLCGSSWCPPRDANNCDARETLTHGSSHTWWLAALNQTKCTQAPTERCCSPAKAVLVEKCVALPRLAVILKACPQQWMWILLTKANMLNTVEGSRLPQQGHTRCVKTYMCFKHLTTQMSWVKEPTYNACMPLL